MTVHNAYITPRIISARRDLKAAKKAEARGLLQKAIPLTSIAFITEIS